MRIAALSQRGAGGDLAAVAAGIVASILPVFLLGTMSVEMRGELGYRETAAGLVLASFFAASALVSARLGRTVDAIGPRRGLTLALAGVAGCQLGLAVVRGGPVPVALLAVLAGVCNATAQLSANVFVARDLPAHRQGIGFAVKQSAMPGASLLAGLLLPVVALTVGWRWAFVGGATAALAALVPVSRRLPVEPRRPRTARRPDGRAAPPPERALVALAVAAAMATGAAITLGGFFVESATDAGVDPAAAGVAFAVGSLISVTVRLVVGAVADRRGGNLLGAVAAMLVVGAVTSALFTVREPWVQFAAVPLAFGAGWAWPGLFNLSVVRAVPGAPGRATGVTQTGTYLGGALGPVLFGAVAERAGYTASWWLAAFLGVSAAAAVLVGRRLIVGSSPPEGPAG